MKIAIAGAGPAGLTLARILALHGVESTVFEREAHAAVRPQGGTLDLHEETGQAALKECGLFAEFRSLARYEDQGMRLYDKHGVLRFCDSGGSEGDRPEIDRGQLRDLLLQSISAETVRWGHILTRAQMLDDGRCVLHFSHGTSEVFDLVIGADGLWSKLRPLLSDAMPAYSGLLFVELNMTDVDTKHTDIAELTGHGKMFALGDNKAIITQRNANHCIQVCAALRQPEDWFASQGIALSDVAAVKARLLQEFERWSPLLRSAIEKGETPLRQWPIYALPVGHRWQHRRGVTVIGDAAHVMSPFSGEGANLAMRDALDLALAIVRGLKGDVDEEVRASEEQMFARAAEAAEGAASAMEETFADDGLEHCLTFMQSHLA